MDKKLEYPKSNEDFSYIRTLNGLPTEYFLWAQKYDVWIGKPVMQRDYLDRITKSEVTGFEIDKESGRFRVELTHKIDKANRTANPGYFSPIEFEKGRIS